MTRSDLAANQRTMVGKAASKFDNSTLFIYIFFMFINFFIFRLIPFNFSAHPLDEVGVPAVGQNLHALYFYAHL